MKLKNWLIIRLFRIQYHYCTNDLLKFEIETNTLNSFFEFDTNITKNYWIEFETETNIAHCVTFEFWGGFVLLLGVPKIHSWNQVVLVLNCRELLVLVMQFNWCQKLNKARKIQVRIPLNSNAPHCEFLVLVLISILMSIPISIMMKWLVSNSKPIPILNSVWFEININTNMLESCKSKSKPRTKPIFSIQYRKRNRNQRFLTDPAIWTNIHFFITTQYDAKLVIWGNPCYLKDIAMQQSCNNLLNNF